MDIRPGAGSAALGLPPHEFPRRDVHVARRRRLMVAYATFVVVCTAVGVWSVVSGSFPAWRPVLWGVGGFGAAALYVLPATFALVTHHRSKDRIVVLNICFGWIPIVWVACLVWGHRTGPHTEAARPAITARKTPLIDDSADNSERPEEEASASQELATVATPVTQDPESALLPLIPVQRMSNPFELPDPEMTRELVAQPGPAGLGEANTAEHLAVAQARVQRRQLTGGPRYALQPGPTPAEQWMESIAVKAAVNRPSTTTNTAPITGGPAPAADKPAPDPSSIVDLAPPS